MPHRCQEVHGRQGGAGLLCPLAPEMLAPPAKSLRIAGPAWIGVLHRLLLTWL
jgi:hypothetical protein